MTVDQRRVRLRERLEIIRARSEKSTSWRSTTRYLSKLINREGFVPIRTRLSQEDISFLATARDDVIALTELGTRLVELTSPVTRAASPATPTTRAAAAGPACAGRPAPRS